jgi:hypothetical protein
MTPEEELIVNRLKATYADVDEMEKVFNIVAKTLALREAEIEQLKAERAALLSEEDSMNYEFGKLKALLTRAADALERAPVLPPKMIEELIVELRKAAE